MRGGVGGLVGGVRGGVLNAPKNKYTFLNIVGPTCQISKH